MDKKELFQIGEIAKLFHVSVGTLRYYEKAGLLQPEYIDTHTGYRYYSTRQFECLNTIRYLRVLGTPLEQIATFLNNKNLDSIQQVLENQKLEISKKRQELEVIEKKIDNRLSQLESAVTSEFDTIKIVKMPSKRVAWIRNSLSVKNHLDLEFSIRQLEEHQNKAVVFLGKVGVGISKEHLKNGKYETYDRVFLILDEEDTYNGEITEIPEHTSAVIRYRRSHREAPEQYAKITKYILEREYEIAGFSSEITMIDYAYTNDTDKFVTEIQIPIKNNQSSEEVHKGECL